MSIVLNIGEHEDWVRRLARRFDRSKQHLEDDLFQEGMIGLMQAADRFDPSMNKSFKRYAYARVSGAMVDWMRRFLPGARPLRGPFKALFIDSLSRQINKTDRQWEPFTVADTVGRDGLEARSRFKILCREVLTAREFRIIEHIYFEKGKAAALRDELGVSESQISHNHSRAKRKLREAIGTPSEIGDFENVLGGRRTTGARLIRGANSNYQRTYYFKVTKGRRAAAKRVSV